MIHRITSATNEKIKEFAALKQASVRNEKRQFLVEGEHMVAMAVDSGYARAIIATTEKKEIPSAIDQYLVAAHIMDKLSQQVTPQGIMAVCDYLPDIDDFGPSIVYLDGVSDPGNVGTIIRTAAAFGMDSIVLGPDCAQLYNPKVVTASQGAIFVIPCATKEPSWLHSQKEKGYRVIGTLLDDKATPIGKFRWPAKSIIVLGSEAHGIRPLVRAELDDKVIIPITLMESLNVAVAAGIVFHQAKNR